ncbi:hypothetical protein [Peribacillus kribbensis]|uniref:hypothetical protein n=1 Tax=Peribacillus kribbensis TaxID=356658 RepID=UPI0003F642E6|nr:hypothetical protein [Peribacillus kribbensis]
MSGNEWKGPQKDAGEQGSVWAGIGIGVLIQFISFCAALSGWIYFLLVGFILQIGVIVYFFMKKRKYTAIGLIILLGFALLVFAACFGLIIYGLG